MPLSFHQRIKYLTYTPCAVAPLSLLGSSITLLTIYRTHRAGSPLQTYHRLLLGISIFDCILSTGFVLGPLPIRSDFPWIGAHGTIASCSFQAFLLQLGSGSFAYSAMLMFYYVLVIRYSVCEETIASRIEPVMHLIPIGYYLGTAIAGLFLQVFNPAGPRCWIAAWPLGCDKDPEVECERRGDHVAWFGLWLLVYPLLGWTCLLVFFLTVVAVTVWRRFTKSRRFVFGGEQSRIRENSSMEKQMRQVITQCFLYAVSFINAMIWSTLRAILNLKGVDDDFFIRNFWLIGMGIFFFPIQGLFSFLIYIRPRYLEIRGHHLEQSRWFALREAVWYPVSTSTERANRSSMLIGDLTSGDLKPKAPAEMHPQ
jgi:hypothetical protein